MSEVLTPIIPENITVHLGPPGSPAQNVTVNFVEYIKNVASSEIYPTWPESALRANIYAIITYALNRIYTEWYPSRGYNFDVTNSTAVDQAFVPNREIFENISLIVDDIFNDYVVRQGEIQPLFTAFCNGTTSRCDGLSQWGSVDLARAGLTPYQILQNYYGQDIGIVENAPVADIDGSYPGVPLRVGDSGNNVKIIQTELNRIARNYPAIPKITEENGIFGLDTQNAVRKFQEIFDLTPSGEVDKSTWYKIKRYYVGVKGLSDLTSEGVTISEAQIPFSTQLREGSQGIGVRTIQYYLNILAYFNPALVAPPLDGVYGATTTNAVRIFQEYYGLPITGIMNTATWNVLNRIYSETVEFLPQGYSGDFGKLYPGYVLSEGMSGQNVSDLQTYLSLIGQNIDAIPVIPVTGYFGSQTKDAVIAVQRAFGIPQNGAVGAITWNTIVKEYDSIIANQNS